MYGEVAALQLGVVIQKTRRYETKGKLSAVEKVTVGRRTLPGPLGWGFCGRLTAYAQKIYLLVYIPYGLRAASDWDWNPRLSITKDGKTML